MLELRMAHCRSCFLTLVISGVAAFVGCSSTDSGSRGSAAGSAGIERAGSAGTAAGGSAASQEQAGSDPGAASGGTPAGNTTGGSAVQGGNSPSSAGNSGTAGGSAFWKPSAGLTWQWQLTGTVDKTVNVDVYDIDGLDNDASVVQALHAQGRKVICYVSVGSYEDWRADAKSFPAAVLGKEYPGWPGERFVDIRAKALREIMAARLESCRQKGFDGIEPDNMDVYGADSGFPLKQQDGIDYAKWLASEAHARGLNIGQKNASEIAMQLEPVFDWVLTEDCYDQGWCADVSVYVAHDKPAFMAEYTDTGVDFNAACGWGVPKKFSPILKGRDLDAAIQFCP